MKSPRRTTGLQSACCTLPSPMPIGPVLIGLPSRFSLLTSCEGHKPEFLGHFNQVNVPCEAAKSECWELAGKKRLGVESTEREE